MTIIEWLLEGDATIKRLTKKYLLDRPVKSKDDGFIERHLKAFDGELGLFGGGIYGPKWISTHYTMLELVAMEANPSSEVFQAALNTLRTRLWPGRLDPKEYHIDLCIAGMLLAIFSYAKSAQEEVEAIIDYILTFQMADGGWNCRLEWRVPNCSSVHTTMNVLEGLLAYLKTDWQYKRQACTRAMEAGAEVLLNRKLYFKKHTQEPIHPAMTKAHFPPRWRYDYLRGLAWFSDKKHPYDERMKHALDLLRSHMKHGRMLRGTAIAGKRRFSLESERFGRFNSLRALKVLKVYDPDFYAKSVERTIGEK